MSVFMYHPHTVADMLTFFIVIFMMVLLVIYERSVASRFHAHPQSGHFDGRRFFNPAIESAQALRPSERKSMSVWLWLLARDRGKWAMRNVVTSKPPERVHDGILVTYINHATVLIQCAGVNLLTDPVWSSRASPFSFMGPKRYAAPGVRMDELPPIDIVLLSHNHYDHMDIASLRTIVSEWNPAIVTGLGNAHYLGRKGMKGAHELDWWDSTEVSGMKITATPAQHFSARSISDRNATLWCGFVIESTAGTIYFAGDTGFGSFVHDIAARFQSVELALIPIGAYEPAWMMQPVHTNPDEALRMHDILHAKHSLGIHHGTFRLTDEPQEEPRERIELLRRDRDFRALPNGGIMQIERVV